MTFRIIRNTRQNALVLFTAANNMVVAGNNSVSSIGLADVTDTITGVGIKQIWSSSDSGGGANGWTVNRGSNTVIFCDSTSWQDFAGNGCEITLDAGATMNVARTGASGTLIMEMQKLYANTGAETGTSNY